MERFWSKVEIRSAEECWEWKASVNNSGYGMFWPTNRETWPAHRYAYYLITGYVDPDLEIHHTCNNRVCVNPHHLREVTGKENASFTDKAQKTHCAKGHEYTPENTYIKPTNSCRNCRQCIKDRSKARHAANDKDYIPGQKLMH